MNDTILAEIRDNILFLPLNRPSAMNAVSMAVSERMVELAPTLPDLVANARVIVLKGAGASFMAGGDIHEFKANMPRTGEMPGR